MGLFSKTITSSAELVAGMKAGLTGMEFTFGVNGTQASILFKGSLPKDVVLSPEAGKFDKAAGSQVSLTLKKGRDCYDITSLTDLSMQSADGGTAIPNTSKGPKGVTKLTFTLKQPGKYKLIDTAPVPNLAEASMSTVSGNGQHVEATDVVALGDELDPAVFGDVGEPTSGNPEDILFDRDSAPIGDNVSGTPAEPEIDLPPGRVRVYEPTVEDLVVGTDFVDLEGKSRMIVAVVNDRRATLYYTATYGANGEVQKLFGYMAEEVLQRVSDESLSRPEAAPEQARYELPIQASQLRPGMIVTGSFHERDGWMGKVRRAELQIGEPLLPAQFGECPLLVVQGVKQQEAESDGEERTNRIYAIALIRADKAMPLTVKIPVNSAEFLSAPEVSEVRVGGLEQMAAADFARLTICANGQGAAVAEAVTAQARRLARQPNSAHESANGQAVATAAAVGA